MGIAVSDALVYNLMYMPLLTVIHYKREKQSCLERCWMVSINMCTSWWHTSAKCYTFLELHGLTQVHQPLQTLAIANDFQVWDLEHISEVVWQLKTIFRGFRHHIISNPSLHLSCLKVDFFDSHQSFWHKFQQETMPFLKFSLGWVIAKL